MIHLGLYLHTNSVSLSCVAFERSVEPNGRSANGNKSLIWLQIANVRTGELTYNFKRFKCGTTTFYQRHHW